MGQRPICAAGASKTHRQHKAKLKTASRPVKNKIGNFKKNL
jgi:hypothetical protein